MRNPWNINDAFDPMFCEDVEINTDTSKFTLKCVVFSDNTGDAFSEDMIQTNRMDICIVIRMDDWPVIKNVHINNVVRRVVNGNVVTYAVSDVIDDQTLGKIIKARSTSISDD